MKVTRILSAFTTVEAEGATVAEVFENLARMEEVFHGREVCGLCSSAKTSYILRMDDKGNKYYESRCLTCGAEFRFGVRRTPAGVLFPQLRDAEGHVKPNGGWTRFQKAHDIVNAAAPAPAAPAPPADDCKKAMDYFTEKLKSVTSAAELNMLLPDLAGFSPAAKIAPWKMLADFATQHGLQYDRVKKGYTHTLTGERS